MMIFINECYKNPQIPYEYLHGFLKLLNPLAPHLTEELNEMVLNNTEELAYSEWPKYDLAKTIDDEITVILQVNGRVRERIQVPNNLDKDTLEKLALENETIKNYIKDSPVKKVIVVPNKLVNIVV